MTKARTINTDSTAFRWVLGSVLAAAYFAAGLWLNIEPSHEAAVRDGICRQLLAGETAGRQGMVSSGWWGPLSTLVSLPFVFLASGCSFSIGPLAASAVFGAATVGLLCQILRLWGAGRWRWVWAAAFAINPLFASECWKGTGTPILSCFVLLATYSLGAWIAHRRIRDLVWFALGTAATAAGGLDLAPWVLAAWICFAVAEFRRKGGAERSATLIVGLLPGLYVVAIWVLMNWLIMGDALYFLRSLFPRVCRPEPVVTAVADWVLMAGGFVVAVAGLGLVRSVWKRDSAEAVPALMALALIANAGLAARTGMLWDTAFWVAILQTLAFLMVGRWLAARSAGGVAAWGVSIPVAGLCAVLLMTRGPEAACDLTGGGAGQSAREREHVSRLAQLEHHVRSRCGGPAVKVFVCGYDGFGLLRIAPKGVFVRALDFNFDKAARDYYGQSLFILVHRPVGRAGMDSLHWKFRDIFVQGGPDTLYDEDWGEWRLFEIIQGSSARKE